LSGVALVLLGGILAFLGSSRTVVVASTVMTVSFFANSYGSYLTAIFKGLQRFDYETLTTTILYGVLLVTQIAVLWLAPSPVNLALCFLASRVVFLVVCAALYRRVVPAGGSRPDAGRAWRMLRESSPFAWYTFSAVLSVQLGTVVLSYFAGETAVGEFQKALRFGMAATIPLALAEDVFYAFLSRVRAQSTERYAEAVIVLNSLGAAIILPLVSATALYGQQLVRVVYGGSVTAVVAESVVVVMGAYLLLYLLFVSPTLMSLGREHANLVIWALGAGSSVIADLLLIPRYGVMGAAYAMLITYGALKLAFVLYARWLGLRLTDARLWIRGIVPHMLAFLGLRWGNAGVGIGLPAIGLVGLLSVWWLLPAQRRVTLWQASSAR
jgi:O-antigen/teichoic acid export membrane protein